MKSNLIRSLLLLTLFGIVLSLSTSTLTSAPQPVQEKQASSFKQKTEATDQIPIVDYGSPASTSGADIDLRARASRLAKGRRYANRVKGFIADRDTSERPILAFRYMAPLPALPTGRSAVVALAEVVDAQAYLSDDKTGVYSEFSLRVEEILKNDGITPVFPGSLLVTERYGGRVRFPSGRVTLYGNREQGLPQRGKRYVFFLERQDEDYSILTAYELRSGRVFPLDGKNAPGGEGSDWAGDAYEGADATRFLNEIQRANI